MNITVPLNKILFLDIETVPQYSNFEDLPENLKELWANKAQRIDNQKTAEELYERAGIYAEFGKIVCISMGIVTEKEESRYIRIKSFYGHDEKEIIKNFFNLLNNSFNTDQHYLCAHNGKEFDFPYISRRAIINGIPLPNILNNYGAKPWEVRFIDTMELWKFGDAKSYTSLDLLATIFNIPSPKDDIKGKDVYRVYYKENNLERIVNYCQKDVITLIQVFLRYRFEKPIPETNIIIT